MTQLKKSPIDDLFFELYGYYPNKPGQAYEMLVAAAFKLLLNKDISYDRRLRGIYSNTIYQLDGLIEDSTTKEMIEAKDYMIYDKKVGRGDIQKLQGALTDLTVEKGFFASATDYTQPSKKYANSGTQNPLHKEIDLFHVRPSTEHDETGRIKTIIIKISMHITDYANGIFQPVWTTSGLQKLKEDGFENKPTQISIMEFYDINGDSLISIEELSEDNPPDISWEENFVANGCWVVKNGFIKSNNELYSIHGINYSIPVKITSQDLVIEANGNPKLYIKAEDGTINKLISDKDLKNVKFIDGKVVINT